jgi:ankyrin repeat protein
LRQARRLQTLRLTDSVARSETPLHVAISRRNEVIARSLIARGADIDAKNRHGQTPLLIAIDKGYGFMAPMLAPMLIDRGADISVKDNHGNTALHIAIVKGNVEMALALLACGIDFDVKNANGKTALALAVGGRDVKMIQEMVERAGMKRASAAAAASAEQPYAKRARGEDQDE